jgi:hypothetical protein
MRVRQSALVALAATILVATAACGGDSDGKKSGAAGTPEPGSSTAAPDSDRKSAEVPKDPPRLPPGKPGKPAGPVPVLDQVKGDPDSIAHAMVVTMKSMDSDIDFTWYDAFMRAAPLLEAEYLSRRLGEVPSSGSGAEWNEWAQHQAYTVAEATVLPPELGRPEDTVTQAMRSVSVRVTPTGRDGWKGETVSATIFVTLVRSSSAAPWKVKNVDESS